MRKICFRSLERQETHDHMGCFCFEMRMPLIDDGLRLDIKLGRCGESGGLPKLLDRFEPR
jgi:hypothetical protein